MMYENFRHTHGSGSGAGKMIQFYELHFLCSVHVLCLLTSAIRFHSR